MPITEENAQFLMEAERWYSIGNGSVAVSPEGSFVAFESGRKVTILDMNTDLPNETPPLRSNAGAVLALTFSPDSSILAGLVTIPNPEFLHRTHLYVWRAEDATPMHVFEPPTARWPYSGMDFTPDGEQLIAATAISTFIYRLSDGRLVRAENNRGGNDVCVQPRTFNAVSVQGDRSVLWNIQDSTTLQTYPNPDAGRSYYQLCAFSPDGRYLALADRVQEEMDGTPQLHLWDTTDASLSYTIDSQLLDISRFPSLSFSPDGSVLAIADREAGYPTQLLRVSDGELLSTLPPARNAVFAADGKQILTSVAGAVSWFRPAAPDLTATERSFLTGTDIINLIKPRIFRPGHSVTLSDGILTVINNDDNSWIAGPNFFPNFPLPTAFTLRLNLTGRPVSLWGREGSFIDRQKYPEWWQGINVIFIGQWDDETIHLTFYDGLSDESYDVPLPSLVQPGSAFSLRFLDPQGRQLEILSENGTTLLHVNIAELRAVNLPDGIFPDRRLVAGLFVGPHEMLTLNEFRIDYEPLLP